MRRLDLLGAAMCLGVVGTAATASASVDLTGVTPVTSIGATDAQNPGWAASPAWFTDNSGGKISSISPTTLTGLTNASVLDFEADHGFGTAAHALDDTSGQAFGGVLSVLPGSFDKDDAISSITTTDGHTIGVQYRTFNYDTASPKDSTLSGPPGATDDSGVFLIGDRSANDTMTSGAQGLIAGPINTAQPRGGVFLTFDTNLQAVSTTVNTSADQSTTYAIAVFDEDGNLLGTYSGGAHLSLYVGFASSAGNIRSIWIGATTSKDAVIIDDVGFVPAVPEPAGLAIFGVGMGGLLLRRRRATVGGVARGQYQ